jgi:hypothetical protein
MTIRARIDVDAVFHDATETNLTVGSLAEHLALLPTVASSFTATAGTAAINITGSTPLSTLVVKNTGSGVIRLAGGINVPAGRLAVIPTTATITVSAPSGTGSYSCIWVG